MASPEDHTTRASSAPSPTRAEAERPTRRPGPRVALTCAALIALITLASGLAPPAGHRSWLLEVAPALALYAVLAATYRRFPLSDLVYVGCVLHYAIVAYGAYYTYAEAPLGDWFQAALDLRRNHYDRLGHLALGFFPALLIRELLLRRTPLQRGPWLSFLVAAVALALGAFWELIEWWVTLLVASDVGQAFLGSQGDVWDAQWDMLLVLVGALAALGLLGRVHDRSLARRCSPTATK